MACDSRESSKSICKEIALQRPKTGKFDYLGRPNYPAHSIAFKFFTNDEVMSTRDQGALDAPIAMRPTRVSEGPALAVSTFVGLSHTAPRLHCPTADQH